MKNIILCGFNWTGCKALDLLLSRKYNIFVYTHESPWYVNDLKKFCISKNIPFSIDKINRDNLPFSPDAICSIYYRNIISEDVIKAAKRKIFNLHPSLLPKYKGCSSLTWAMINGEKKAGFSYHFINNKVDAGNIIIQKEEPIYDYDTQTTLYNRIMFKAMDHFYEALDYVLNDGKGYKQIGMDSYYSRGCPYKGELQNNWSKGKKERFIRAMIFPPLPQATFKGKKIDSMDEINEEK